VFIYTPAIDSGWVYAIITTARLSSHYDKRQVGSCVR
jgi:hypothetical protein